MSKKYKIALVIWVDAVAGSGWSKISDVDPIHRVESIGWLIYESEKEIKLALCKSGDEVNATITIPRSWVIKKRIVKL